jgi:hypothetical protein
VALEQLTLALVELFELSPGQSPLDDAEMTEEYALSSAPDAGAESSEDASGEDPGLPAGKRRAHSEGP